MPGRELGHEKQRRRWLVRRASWAPRSRRPAIPPSRPLTRRHQKLPVTTSTRIRHPTRGCLPRSAGRGADRARAAVGRGR
eukprot:scaffold80958_cov24-Tisochrysis_lutea.AAC.1